MKKFCGCIGAWPIWLYLRLAYIMVDAFVEAAELAGLADAFVEAPDVRGLDPPLDECAEAPGIAGLAGALAVGDIVEVHGLTQNPEFDSRRGWVVRYWEEQERWIVCFDEVTRKNLKARNLRLVVPEASLLEGTFCFFFLT